MAFKRYIWVCADEACASKEGSALYDAFLRELREQDAEEQAQVVKTGCFALCGQGPVVKIVPDETLYVGVQLEDAAEIVREHIGNGRPVERLLIDRGENQKRVRIDGLDYYQKQFRVVLRNCGIIDPESIDEYITRDGYAGLERALFDLTPEGIIEELKVSGLRGRGGAGYPTWKKWSFSHQAPGDEKFVICNADEGDPGAYMDRSTIEGDPHSVLEAMIIAGRAVGANTGYFYVRAEYPLAIQRLEKAIEQAHAHGLLGKDILGSGFDFEAHIRLGAGAFVCGEETALIASIEGKRGMPIPRPPFPAVRGLWNKPTVINNVETLANIPMILHKGGDWFRRIGTETTTGTKVFALTGKIHNSGLVEVPMGTTLREIVFDIGGGIKGGKAFKAVQTGGPSGGVIPADFLDTPIDYETLQKLGSIMGSGGMIVMDEDDCMVDVNRFYLDFTVDESCGKCAPCRVGGRTLYNILDRITKGNGKESDIEQMREIGHAMQKASLCGLGQTASNPVVSTLRYFRDEYFAHIRDGQCPAHKCRSLVKYFILPDTCIGCGVCARRCPVHCIQGEKRGVHEIDQAECIKCGECYQACKFEAVSLS